MSIEFIDRLRDASIVFPDGSQHFFKTDSLTKKGGKKLSTQEIVDSNKSVTQDQGNKTYEFPLSIYFTGDDFDSDIDEFLKALEERFTLPAPPILLHPIWGDINVFPVSWDVSIGLVSGVGVGTIELSLIEVFDVAYPKSALDSLDGASSALDAMEGATPGMLEQMFLATTAAVANVRGIIESAVGAISTAVETLEAIEDEINAIQSEIEGLIDDVAGNITQLLFATQRLMRAPGRFLDSTLGKINTYKDMITDIIDGITNDAETSPVNLKNNSILMQTIAGFAVGCLAEASAFTEYKSRSDSISAIETIENSTAEFNTAFAESRTTGDVSKEYSGDHNFYSSMFEATNIVRRIIINETFDLKAEKRFKLTENSDIINLCYEYYGKVDNETIQTFIDSNKICCDEFIELARGREITIYV